MIGFFNVTLCPQYGLRPTRFLWVLLGTALSLTACGSQKLGYEVRGREVYYLQMVPGKVIPGIWAFEDKIESRVPEADAKTFQILKNSSYAKDAKQVFYQGKLIPGAEAATFQWVSSDYAKDQRRVYAQGSAIAGADPGSFKMLWKDDVWQDKRDWYVKGQPVHIRDMASLKLVVNLSQVNYRDGNLWAYDKYNYYAGRSSSIEGIPIAHPATFQVMKNDSNYAKDQKYVYYLNDRVDGADPRTFQALGHRYGKDAKRAYYEGSVFTGVDLASLQAVGRDKFSLYDQTYSYAKDFKRAYCAITAIDGADVATFVADENGAQDKNRHYHLCQPVQQPPKSP